MWDIIKGLLTAIVAVLVIRLGAQVLFSAAGAY